MDMREELVVQGRIRRGIGGSLVVVGLIERVALEQGDMDLYVVVSCSAHCAFEDEWGEVLRFLSF